MVLEFQRYWFGAGKVPTAGVTTTCDAPVTLDAWRAVSIAISDARDRMSLRIAGMIRTILDGQPVGQSGDPGCRVESVVAGCRRLIPLNALRVA